MLQINLKGVVNTSGGSNITAGNCFIVGTVNERTLLVIDKNGVIGRVGIERVTVLSENNPSINNTNNNIKEVTIIYNQSKEGDYIVVGNDKGFLTTSLLTYSSAARIAFIKYMVECEPLGFQIEKKTMELIDLHKSSIQKKLIEVYGNNIKPIVKVI